MKGKMENRTVPFMTAIRSSSAKPFSIRAFMSSIPSYD